MTRKWVSAVYVERNHMEIHTQRRTKPSTVNWKKGAKFVVTSFAKEKATTM